MPYSARENDQDIIWFVQDFQIRKILDVGAGSGTYGRLLGRHIHTVDAVEIWQPYVEQFKLNEIYDHIIHADVRHVSPLQFEHYDLVIFGDVLEHMSREESLKVWRNASTAKFGMISVPIVHYPQGAEFGNPYEEHIQEHLTADELRKDYGPFIFEREYEVTGTFIRQF